MPEIMGAFVEVSGDNSKFNLIKTNKLGRGDGLQTNERTSCNESCASEYKRSFRPTIPFLPFNIALPNEFPLNIIQSVWI